MLTNSSDLFLIYPLFSSNHVHTLTCFVKAKKWTYDESAFWIKNYWTPSWSLAIISQNNIHTMTKFHQHSSSFY